MLSEFWPSGKHPPLLSPPQFTTHPSHGKWTRKLPCTQYLGGKDGNSPVSRPGIEPIPLRCPCWGGGGRSLMLTWDCAPGCASDSGSQERRVRMSRINGHPGRTCTEAARLKPGCVSKVTRNTAWMLWMGC